MLITYDPAVCEELQRLQRRRSQLIKTKVSQSNGLLAIVASNLGYHSQLSEEDRSKFWKDADQLVRRVLEGEQHELADLIEGSMLGVTALKKSIKRLEKEMEKAVKQLPIHEWALLPEQRGFGLVSLAVVIGEAGDLSSYANPGKLWKRLGCAPYESQGKTLMGSTWRGGKEGKLTAMEWEDYGYNPRRRSIAYVIGENLVKQNKDIYRHRYDTVKAKALEEREDWTKLRCHRHAMLLSTKLLLKNLWIEWNPGLAKETVT